MSPLSARTRRALVTALMAVAATTGLAALPQPAAAKTFVASFDDPSGDASTSDDAHDVVHARVAYNRRTGAISASVQMAGTIADQPSDAVVIVWLSDLKNGKCMKATMTLAVTLADPSVPVSWLGAVPGKRRWMGSGAVEDDTVNFRVRAKSLSGKHPGCTVVIVTTPDDSGTIIDQTAGNDGFA